MRRISFVLLVVGLMVTSAAWAQRGTAQVEIGGKNIEIEYGRPSLQGRDMLSKLPIGQAWRMGMNTATMLKTDAMLHFGDVMVAAGEYRLTAKRVSETDWHLVIAKDETMIEVPLKDEESKESVEVFTITLEAKDGSHGHFNMAWGAMSVGADFSVH